MKKLLSVIVIWALVVLPVSSFASAPGMFIGTGSPSANHTFTQVQAGQFTGAACGSTPCTLTIPSTGSGTLGRLWMANTNGGDIYITAVSGCGGAWVVPASGHINNGSVGTLSYAYNLTMTSSCTSLSVTLNTNGSYNFHYRESSYTPAGAVLDGSCVTNSNSASASPSGVALTLATSSELIDQAIGMATGEATAIGGGYGDFVGNTGFHSSTADLFNTASGTAPTWTSTNAQSIVAGCAFK